MEQHEKAIVESTRQWVDRVVIGHNLCPFAKAIAERLRIEVYPNSDLEGLVNCLVTEITRLVETSADELPTTLVVLPVGLADFETYLDVVAMSEAVIEDLGFSDDLQVASFHPKYIFEETDADDPANWTNRSPYPMVHLLRSAEVAYAIETHPDVDEIPERNVNLFRSLGHEQVSLTLAGCYSGSEQ